MGGALRRCGPAAILYGLFLGGLYLGYFTDTEAAAVAPSTAFMLALLRGKLRPARFLRAMSENVRPLRWFTR